MADPIKLYTYNQENHELSEFLGDFSKIKPNDCFAIVKNQSTKDKTSQSFTDTLKNIQFFYPSKAPIKSENTMPNIIINAPSSPLPAAPSNSHTAPANSAIKGFFDKIKSYSLYRYAKTTIISLLAGAIILYVGKQYAFSLAKTVGKKTADIGVNLSKKIIDIGVDISSGFVTGFTERIEQMASEYFGYGSPALPSGKSTINNGNSFNNPESLGFFDKAKNYLTQGSLFVLAGVFPFIARRRHWLGL